MSRDVLWLFRMCCECVVALVLPRSSSGRVGISDATMKASVLLLAHFSRCCDIPPSSRPLYRLVLLSETVRNT